MDQQLQKELEQKLLAQKKKLEDQLSKFTTKDKKLKGDYDANFPNIGDTEEDNAQEVAEYQTGLSLEASLETTLAEVNQSLEKIKEGAYGICDNCGQKISVERLKALPQAKYCLKCEKE